jgi:hypothetical protein
MGRLWRTARAKLLISALAAGAMVAVVLVSLIALSGSSAPPTRGAKVRPGRAIAQGTATIYHPLRITPPQTAVERTVNQTLKQSSNLNGLAALEASTFPAPATGTAFPPVEAADTQSPTMYAMAFTQELLDLDFATATRNELLAWASYNNAPNTTIDIPASSELKVLPDSLTTSPALLPSRSQWATNAVARTMWRVSGLVISVSPTWTQALSAGWKSVDPLMVIYDVSGTLTVTTPGRTPVVESIAFGLTLGGASWHSGYGAVAVDDWTVN